MEKVHNYALKSLISIMLTSSLTLIHHVYRLGWNVLPMFLLITLLPLGLLLLFRRYESKIVLGAYGLLNLLIFLAFGFFDGFLDHVFKLLGLNPVTFLEGSDAEIVETVFHLWSIEAGYWFYELTGVFASIASFVALYYTVQFIRNRVAFDAAKPLTLQSN